MVYLCDMTKKTFITGLILAALAFSCKPEPPVDPWHGHNPHDQPKDTTHFKPTDMKPCSVTSITDDMFFNTALAGTYTSVSQGFDFNDNKSLIFFSQVTSGYKNTIGWTRPVPITASNTVAPSRMTLLYFSHGNNIRYEKGKDGNDYIWIANYGTRDSEDKYTNPQILSRIRLAAGTTFRNTQATDNYYFGTKTLHAAFDVPNDRIAIFSQLDGYRLRIYRLSDVLSAPLEEVTLPETLTYGGGTSKVAPDPEWTGKPTVLCHNCTKIQPLHTLIYNYPQAGRGWQTYTIADGRVYFFLFYKKSTNGMTYQSVIDILDYNGNYIRKDVLQPFADNLADLEKYHLTDRDYRYMENEGIIIRDGVAYLLYAAKMKNDGLEVRRPVVFQIDASSLER